MKDYTVEYAEGLAADLRALPTPEKATQRLDKQGVVRHIIAAIEELLERGFTIEQVAESLRGKGFDITTPTLKSYLQRIRGKKPRKAPKPTPPSPLRALPPVASREQVQDTTGRGSGSADADPAGDQPKQSKNTSSEFLNTDRKKL